MNTDSFARSNALDLALLSILFSSVFILYTGWINSPLFTVILGVYSLVILVLIATYYADMVERKTEETNE